MKTWDHSRIILWIYLRHAERSVESTNLVECTCKILKRKHYIKQYLPWWSWLLCFCNLLPGPEILNLYNLNPKRQAKTFSCRIQQMGFGRMPHLTTGSSNSWVSTLLCPLIKNATKLFWPATLFVVLYEVVQSFVNPVNEPYFLEAWILKWKPMTRHRFSL